MKKLIEWKVLRLEKIVTYGYLKGFESDKQRQRKKLLEVRCEYSKTSEDGEDGEDDVE